MSCTYGIFVLHTAWIILGEQTFCPELVKTFVLWRRELGHVARRISTCKCQELDDIGIELQEDLCLS